MSEHKDKQLKSYSRNINTVQKGGGGEDDFNKSLYIGGGMIAGALLLFGLVGGIVGLYTYLQQNKLKQ
jgi:hypothetical protein